MTNATMNEKPNSETLTVKSADIVAVVARLNSERRKILDAEIHGDSYVLHLAKRKRATHRSEDSAEDGQTPVVDVMTLTFCSKRRYGLLARKGGHPGARSHTYPRQGI